jgi:predicted esterase
MPSRCVLLLCSLLCGEPMFAAEFGHQPSVAVTQATRLDWVFALANQSPAKPPADWLPEYRSTDQAYELFVPASYDASQTWPLILFISAGDQPAGLAQWRSVCERDGVLFASPHRAGNNCDMKQRVRIVLDVLDDVRRNYNIDPDRTYIAGFSGGGRIAGHIAATYPEHFGGMAPVCATGELRDEPWLQHRLIDRLSVALVTGESDFNRGECERFMFTWLGELGVRTKVWVPKGGHAIPDAKTQGEVFKWLEDGLARRRELAKQYPAMRIAGNAAPARAEQAAGILAEGKLRLQEKATTYSGMMLLAGCALRWEGTPAAAEAKKIYLDYNAKPEKPWDEDDANYERRFALGRARGLDAYASGQLPPQYAKEREAMIKEALALYTKLLKDGKSARGVEEAKKRIPELMKLLKQ